MNSAIVKIVSIGIAATALYSLLIGWDWLWWVIGSILRGEIQTLSTILTWKDAGLNALTYIIIVLKFFTAYGLFRFLPWARILAITVLSCDFLIRIIGIINIRTFYLRHPEMIEQLGMMNNLPKEQIKIISMWPTYIICALALASLIIISQKSVKNLFMH